MIFYEFVFEVKLTYNTMLLPVTQHSDLIFLYITKWSQVCHSTEILQRDYLLAQQKVKIEEQSTQLQEQSAQLQEQSTQLRKSVQLLIEAKLTPEAIATSLGMSVDDVMRLME